MDIFTYFFSWYQGAVWSNLLASAITTIIALIWGYRKVMKHSKRNHEELMGHVSKIHTHLGIKEKK